MKYFCYALYVLSSIIPLSPKAPRLEEYVNSFMENIFLDLRIHPHSSIFFPPLNELCFNYTFLAKCLIYRAIFPLHMPA